MPGLGCMPRTPTPMWVEPWTSSDPDVRRVGSPSFRGQTPDDGYGIRLLGSPPPGKGAGRGEGEDDEEDESANKEKSMAPKLNANGAIHRENMSKGEKIFYNQSVETRLHERFWM